MKYKVYGNLLVQSIHLDRINACGGCGFSFDVFGGFHLVRLLNIRICNIYNYSKDVCVSNGAYAVIVILLLIMDRPIDKCSRDINYNR